MTSGRHRMPANPHIVGGSSIQFAYGLGAICQPGFSPRPEKSSDQNSVSALSPFVKVMRCNEEIKKGGFDSELDPKTNYWNSLLLELKFPALGPKHAKYSQFWATGNLQK